MISVGNLRVYDKLPAEEKLLTLVLALVGRDRSDCLRIDRSLVEPSVRLVYRADDQLYEMVPPPVHVWPAIVRRLQRETRFIPRRILNRLRGGKFPDSPTWGTLPVRYGDVTCTFNIQFFRGRTAQHIWMEKSDSLDVSQVSAEFLRRRLRGGPEELREI